MRTLLFSCTLLFTVYTFKSCNICSCKKVPCPAFEDVNYLSWFPYQQGQQLIFKHQSAYDTITLSNSYKSKAYEASQGCYSGDDGCHQSLSIASREFTNNLRLKFSISYSSQTVFGSTETKKSISLFLKGFSSSSTDINNQGLVMEPGIYRSNYSPSLVINGASYNSVQTIIRDTLVGTFTQQPYKVYISKGTGLIAYEMFPSHELWIKQ